jgi:hypothetical protein
LIRDGIELTAGFTATVNADLQVGSLEESITVSGAAPMVDIQNVRQQTTLARETLDALPTTRRVAQMITLIPGATAVSATLHDVGGVGSERSEFAIHGQRAQSDDPQPGGHGSCRGAATCAGTLTIELIPPNTLFEDRLQQVDLRFTRIFRLRTARVQGSFDVYNVFNASSILNVNTRYGSSWQNVIQIMGGRLLKFSARLDF